MISADRLILLGIAAFSRSCLWLLLPLHQVRPRRPRAVAENERAAASLGWSPDRVATLNWALGCGLAGLAAILIVPIVTLQPAVLTNLVLAATAAALVAGFRSFPIAFVAGLAIGIVQTEVNRYVDQPGVGDSRAVRPDRRLAGGPRPGAAAARLPAAAPADDRQRPASTGRGSPSAW